ncbi:VanZ family protein [Cohnella sp.]|uniref:VanZ family protein n=1 Tax=Cohnella sp. TaxID=1883426 RepID=UPI0035661D8C
MYKHKGASPFVIITSLLALLLWMIIIFNLSAQPAAQSDRLSKKVTKVIINTVDKISHLDTGENQAMDLVEKLNHIVRKYAHGGVFFVLGILVMNVFSRSGVRGFKALVFSLLFSILYAVSDEIHQLSVAGRGAQVMDVFIDSCGAFIGIGLYRVADRIVRKYRVSSK